MSLGAIIPPFLSRLKINKPDYTFTFLLTITALLYFAYTFKKYDITPSDDYVYMNSGYFLSFPLTENYLGFFYPLFFKVFFFLTGFKNILTNTYIAYYLLSTGVSLGIYFYLKSIGIKKQISFFVSFVFLFSDYQILLFPKISIFCFLLIIFTLWFAQNKENFIQFFIITVLCWVLGYTRPEFFFSYILSFAGLIILFFRDKKYTSIQNFALLFFPVLLLAFGIFLLNGQPVTHRGLDAFKQHFILNYLSWHPDLILNNASRSEFKLFQEVYGNVDSMFEVFSVNPSLFIKHISYNFTNYVKLSNSLLISIFIEPIFPVFQATTKYFVLFFIVSFCIVVDFKASFFALKHSLMTFLKTNGIIILIILFPTLVSVILIYPREHYFFFHLVIYFSIIGYCFNAIVFRKNLRLKFIFILILTVWGIGYIIKSQITHRDTKTLAMYEFILEKAQTQKVTLLSNEPFSPIFFKEYLDKFYLNSFQSKSKDSITKIINQHHLNFIYLDMKAIDNNNKELVGFIENEYKNYGFKKIVSYQDINYLIFVK